MRILPLCCFALLALDASAAVELAPLFTDHAVLQRDQPLPVWGRATPGETITVTFHDQTAQTTTAADGRWSVRLKPLAADIQPAELVVAGANILTLRDVVVGDVWLASGQSNMEWPVNRTRDAAQEMAEANFPLIRHLKIEHVSSPSRSEAVKAAGWRAASPETVGGFTAVGYFFAREVHRKINVPIGIIHSSWGGTAIESWLSDSARNSTSLAAKLAARWAQSKSEWTPERIARYPADLAAWRKADAEAKATKTKNLLPWPQPPATDDSPALPGGLFNAMIAPLQPVALRGVLWYQGEGNADHADEYAELFSALIRTWRTEWDRRELPFYFVQIPNFADDDARGQKWAKLREAQAKALALAATGMAVAIDIGDPENIHPLNKQEVGRRLALLALSRTYDRPEESSGPQFVRAVREGVALRVTFQHAGGLMARDGPVQSVEVAGVDEIFHPASAVIEREALIVSSPAVPKPVAVRYAWSNAPTANLYNSAGLPAAPFRSDTR